VNPLPILISLLVPRVAIAVLWLFTGWFSGVFDNYLLPVVGFLLAPYTLLWVSLVENVFGGAWGIASILGTIVAVGLDVLPMLARR
jgi:hypothetical protein